MRKKHLALGPVSRSVKVLQYLGEHGQATIKDAAADLSLAPSTVHRLFDLLAKENFIEHDQVGRNYRIGSELFRLSAKVFERFDVRQTALPILNNIVKSCDETCLLGLYISSIGKMTFAEKVDSSRVLRYQVPLNTHVSVFWGASGRSILAFLSDEDIKRIYDSEPPAPATGEMLPSLETLHQELAEIRRTGIAFSRGDKIPGAIGIAAPLFGASGAVVGSIAATIPATELNEEKEQQIRALIKSEAAELSSRLGAPARSKRGVSGIARTD